MKNRRTWKTSLPLAALSVLLASTGIGVSHQWRQYQNPAEAGWSAEGLAVAKTIAEEIGSASVMLVEGGVVVAAWGEVDRPFPILSMRKGLYNALVGIVVAEERIHLDATLRELDVDETSGLTDLERTATVRQILGSRSGIYHVSAYEPASMKRSRPERGSRRPGEHWFYNNWDFNLVAHLIEKASGSLLGELFRERIAEPLGMQDYSVDDAFSFLEPSRSRYPAVIFRMSARDLARFGQLYLQRGTWRGEQLLEKDWIDRSWTPTTVFDADSAYGEGNGFGYLWWIYPKGRGPFLEHDVFLTRGSDGQILAVLPAMDLVFVHQTDSDHGSDAEFEDAARLMRALIAAKAPDGGPRTGALDPVPLPGARPAPERSTAVPWTPEIIRSMTGEYALNPQISFLVHEVGGRLFALPRGIPLAEVELFIDHSGTVFSPAVELSLQVVEREDGEAIALEGLMDGRPVRLQRE